MQYCIGVQSDSRSTAVGVTNGHLLLGLGIVGCSDGRRSIIWRSDVFLFGLGHCCRCLGPPRTASRSRQDVQTKEVKPRHSAAIKQNTILPRSTADLLAALATLHVLLTVHIAGYATNQLDGLGIANHRKMYTKHLQSEEKAVSSKLHSTAAGLLPRRCTGKDR